jgi:hypothetical protein
MNNVLAGLLLNPSWYSFPPATFECLDIIAMLAFVLSVRPAAKVIEPPTGDHASASVAVSIGIRVE